MSAFYDNNITNLGRKLLADMQLGAKFVPTKIVIGSGYMPADKTTQTIEDVVEVVQEISLNKVEKTTDGNCVFGGVLTNASVSKPFYFRELALYAKVIYPEKENKESAEVLYSYGNAKENAELIPAYGTGNAIERQMDLIVYIGNDTEVKLEIKSGLYVDLKEFQETIQRIDAEIEEIKIEFGKLSDKIGEPTDNETKQTVFGKIAGVLKRVIGIDDKVGTATDTAAQATLFGKIKGITDNVSGNLKPMNDKIGQPADNETTQTVFGKIADLKKVIMEKLEVIHSYVANVDSLAKQIQAVIGTSPNDNNIHSLFGRLKIVQDANNMTNSRIGTSSDSSSSNTLFGKIANINHKLSGMSVVRKITRGVGVGQIDRYNHVEDFVVNVSISNTNKVVVIINNHWIGRSAYRQGTGNGIESVSIFGAYAKEITNSKVVMSPAYSMDSGEGTGEKFEYCIVEFY